MSEWRKDPITDRWVIISTERGKRPFDYRWTVKEKKIKECPFCEGNEHKTPSEIMAYRGKDSCKDSPGWWIRVVPNKYPAVMIEGEISHQQRGVYSFMKGFGAHEVIIESNIHEPGLDKQTEKQIEEVIWAWRDRLLDLRKDTRLKYIQIFKNTGSIAGASIDHTHSQLIAMPMVPVDIRQEIKGIMEYFNLQGSCIICDIIMQETAERERVVIDRVHFLSFTPFASRFPFETWIVPKEHQHDFVQVRREQVRELASVLKTILRKMSIIMPNIPHNIVLHTAPINLPEDYHYHWHIEIIPRSTVIAGFELGTGYFVNPTPPEMAAKALRETGKSCPLL